MSLGTKEKLIIIALDEKIVEFKNKKTLRNVTYNVGFIKALEFAKEVIMDIGAKDDTTI